MSKHDPSLNGQPRHYFRVTFIDRRWIGRYAPETYSKVFESDVQLEEHALPDAMNKACEFWGIHYADFSGGNGLSSLDAEYLGIELPDAREEDD